MRQGQRNVTLVDSTILLFKKAVITTHTFDSIRTNRKMKIKYEKNPSSTTLKRTLFFLATKYLH